MFWWSCAGESPILRQTVHLTMDQPHRTFPIQIPGLMPISKLKMHAWRAFQLKYRHQPTPSSHLDRPIAKLLGNLLCNDVLKINVRWFLSKKYCDLFISHEKCKMFTCCQVHSTFRGKLKQYSVGGVSRVGFQILHRFQSGGLKLFLRFERVSETFFP